MRQILRKQWENSSIPSLTWASNGYSDRNFTDSDEYIIVEMQNKSQPFFKNRSIYYMSRSIIEQGERGAGWNYDIKAVYLIAFLNFHMKGLEEKFRTDVALMDMQQLTLFSDKERMIFLQLPDFTKELEDCDTIFERFIYVLKHMDILQRMPFLAQDAVFKRLSEIAEVASLSKEERQEYDENLKHYRDTIAVMQGQYLEGEEKGREEGRAEGRAEGHMDVAKQLKLMGLSAGDIAKATGLSVEEIMNL